MSHEKMTKQHISLQLSWILKGCVFLKHILPVISVEIENVGLKYVNKYEFDKLNIRNHPCENVEHCFNFGGCAVLRAGKDNTIFFMCNCQQFAEPPFCHKERNFCHPDNPCHPSSECYSTWGVPYCECPDGREGPFCQDQIDEGHKTAKLKNPVFLFDPDIWAGDTHFFLAYLNSNIEGDDLNFDITFDNYKNIFSSKVEWMNATVQSYINLFASFLVKKRLRVDAPRRVLLFEYTFDDSHRNVASVIFRLKNGDQIQYDRLWYMKVQRHPFQCVPTITLKDSARIPTLMMIERRQRYVFHGEAQRDCPEVMTTLKYKWNVYYVEKTNYSFDGGRWKNFVTTKENHLYFVLSPFLLRKGNHTLVMQVEEIVTTEIYKKKYTSSRNRKTCRFGITENLPVARIRGGESRYASFQRELKMDGSESLDPNEDSNHQNLQYSWSCESKTRQQGLKVCKGLDEVVFHDKIWLIPANNLTRDEEITFQLIVKNRQSVSIPFQQIVTVSSKKSAEIIIRCELNCETGREANPQEDIIFQVICVEYCEDSHKRGNFIWSQYKGPDINWAQTKYGQNSYILCIRNGSLKNSETYGFTFTVGVGSSTSRESVSFSTSKLPNKLDCEPNPSEGYEGITDFYLECGLEHIQDLQLSYQVIVSSGYDRLMFFDSKKSLGSMKLPRGVGESHEISITIVTNLLYGPSVTQNMKPFKVIPINETIKNVTGFLNTVLTGNNKTSLSVLRGAGNYLGVLNWAFVLPTIIGETSLTLEDKISMRKKLVSAISKVTIVDFLTLKQVSSALLNIIATDSEVLDYILAHQAVDLADKLSVILQDKTISDGFSTEEMLKISKNMLTTLAIITNELSKADEMKTEEEGDIDFEFEVYSDVSAHTVNKYKAMPALTTQFLAAVQKIGFALLNRMSEFQDEVTINLLGFFMWLKIDTPKTFVSQSIGLVENNSLIQISEELAAELGNNTHGIQVLVVGKSLYWWHPSAKRIKNPTISVVIKDLKTEEIRHDLSHNLDLFLRTSEDLDKNQAVFNISRREDNYAIFRIKMRQGETVLVGLNTSLGINMKVVIRQNELPTLEDILAADVTTAASDTEEPQFVTTSEIAINDDAWFFVGLAPADQEDIEEDSIINYHFLILTTKCQFWDSKKENWIYKGCHVGRNTTTTKLHCLCNHTSTFVGYTIGADYRLMDLRNIPFYLNVKNNFNMLIFVVALLVAFSIVFVAATFLDKRDRKKRKMIILGDNFTQEHYAYLITVYTGNARNAGTTSTVAVQLAGSINNSKPHLLISKTQHLLQTGATNWFVIFTRKHLGNIEGIYIWHNNSGHRPPWYCDVIVCRDIQTRERWVFLASRWLSVLRDKRLSYCQLTPATNEELRSKKLMLHQNIVYNFIENHLWLSVFTKRPQSFFTRNQRVAVLASGVTFAMLLNKIFYGISELTTTNPAFRLEEGVFTFDIKDAAFAFASVLVSEPLNFILSFLFRKTLSTNVHVSRTNQKKKKLRASPDIYADVELERKFGFWEKYIFYCLPIDPLCQTQVSVEKRVFSRPGDSPLSRKLHGDKFTPFSFPPWTRYLTWSICGVIILSCSTGVAFIGIYVGELTSYKWMLSVILIILMSALIVEPIKIVLISLIYTYKLEVHPFDLDLLRGYPLKPLIEKTSKNQRTKRKDEYKPLPTKLIPDIRKRELDRIYMHTMVWDIFIHIVYAIVIFWVAQANTNPYEYQSTLNVKNMFIYSRYYGIPLTDVRNYHTLLTYLRETVVPTSNEVKLLEEKPAERTTWTADNNCQIIGVLRLRQLRVSADNKCQEFSPVVKHLTCQPGYSDANADTANYGIGWTRREDMDITFSERSRKPWIYVSAQETGSYHTVGKFATYPGGGYVADLGRTRNNSRLMLDYLLDNNWIDLQTRFIAIEFTIYNVNVKLFNVVTIIIEKTPTGLYRTSYDIRTSKLISRLDIDDVNMYVALVIYVVITTVFIYLQVSSIQRLSFKTHFQDIWNIADVIVTIWALISIIIFFVRHQYVSALLQSLLIAEDVVHVSFHGACGIDFALTYVIAFLCVAAILRIWRILRYSECFYIFEQTFVYAAKSVCAVLFFMGVFLLGFSCFVSLTLGGYTAMFVSPISSLVTFVSMSVGQNAGIDYNLFSSIDRVLGPLIYIIFAVLSVIFMTKLCTAIIMEYYSVSKEAKELTREVHAYTFMDYVRDEYNFHCKKIRCPKIWKKKRLRGGGDDIEDICSEFPSDSEDSTSPNYRQLNSSKSETLSTQYSKIESKKYDSKENSSIECEVIIEKQTMIDIQKQIKKCKTDVNSLFSKNLSRNALLKKRKNGISQIKDMFRKSMLRDQEIYVGNNETNNDSKRKNTIINKLNPERPKAHERKQGRTKIILEHEIEIFNDQLDVLSDRLSKIINTVTINKDQLKKILQKKKNRI